MISRALFIMWYFPHLSADHINPVNNVYLGFKTVNIFESSSHKIAYGIDGLKPTYTRKCIRPYQNENVLIPDQYCDSYKAPADKTVHFSFVHAETADQFAASYSEAMEFDINISLLGGVGVNLFDVGAMTASFENQWAYEYYKDVTLSAFIAAGRTSCYEVAYSDFYSMAHADELKQLIMNAPLTYDAAYYTKLYSIAGTHVQTSTVFGGATVEVAFAGEKTMEASFQTETSLEVCAQENLWYVSATEKDSIHLSTNAQTYYKIVGSNYNVFYEGTAPTDNDQKKYNADVCIDPQPIKVKITPIAYTLKNSSNSLQMDQDSLDIIANNMIRGFADYCSYYTCVQNPTPTVKPWESAITVVGNDRKKLIREDEGLCVLSELRKLSYATCYLEIAAHEVGETTRYWYVGGASTNSVICSALCSKSIGGWLKNKGSALNARQYGSVAPGNVYQKPYSKTVIMEPAATSHCFLSRIDNENQCDDYCWVHRADGYFKLDIFVAASCHDEKHTNNKGQHGCYAMCVDTTEAVDFYIKMTVTPNDGEVPVALANETYCMINNQQLAGSFNSDVSTGGGCKLEQKLVAGREGVYWVFTAIRPTAAIDAGWCYNGCSVMCSKLN